MPPTVEEFARNLAQSGLMTGEEFARWREDLSGDKRRDDSQALAIELVNSGKLTRYQAASVFQGKTEGLVLGRYVVQEKIGSGGMGHVYKAFDKRLERVVALKLVKVNALASAEPAPQLPSANGPRQVKLPAAEAVAQLFREAKTAARMQHPNIVTVHDADEAEGVFFVAMEYIDGRDLAAIVKERHPLPLEEAVDYIMQAARGLAYAHGRGVVHRDIKPANLVLDSLGTIKILDLGLARHVDEAENESDTGQGGLTQAGQVVGTVDFMSPEQAEDMRQADERSDIYSLGCTLYFLLSGKPPYSADTLVRKFLSHREWPIPSLRDLRPEAPQSLDALFRRLVAKRPEDRISSMQELISELSACFAPPPPPIASPELPKATAVQEPPPPPPLPPPIKAAGVVVPVPASPHEMPKLPAGFAPPRNPKPGAVWINSIGMRLNCLPAGAFLMGSPEDEKKRNDDEVLHPVRISRLFLLGAYPVTQSEFEKVMGHNPSHFSLSGVGHDKMQGLDGARFPVENVSWDEAEEFCRMLSTHEGQEYRLPTEAEWEYAARAGTTTVFHFGDSLVGNEANCICRSPYGTSDKGKYLSRTTPVGSYASNAFDLYDMHGNVWEWCHDWYDENSHRDSPPEDPAGPLYGGPWRVARGGNWRLPAAYCRAAFRNAFEPVTRDSGIGFRVALTVTR